MRLSVANDRVVESESIANQQYVIRHFVENHPDISLVSEHIDDGHSGLVFNRPSFTEMIQDAMDGKINCIIVKDLSRFGREFVETGRFLRKLLPAHGVRFIAVLDGVDTSRIPAQDDLLMQIKTVINDEFSRDISTKTRNALLSMRKNGLYVGACPIYGYRKSNENKNHLVVDEYAAAIVKDIFRMKIEGLSAAAIADKLNRRNILSPLAYKKSLGMPFSRNGFADTENTNWSVTTIFRILKDEIYTGTLVQGKHYTLNYKIRKPFIKPSDEWLRVENTHEAIISRYDFGAVRRIMRLDTRASPGADRVGLFSGILVCGSCNNHMTRKMVTHGGKTYSYYRCPAKNRSCQSPASIPEDKLTSQAFEQIGAYISEMEVFIQKLSQINAAEADRELAKSLTVQIDNKQKDLGQTVFFKSNLRSSLLGGIISEDDYGWMKADYSEKIATLENEIDRLALDVRDIIKHKDEFLTWLGVICRNSHVKPFDRASLVRVVKCIRVGGDGDVEVVFMFTINT